MSKPNLANQYECTGCFSCIDKCPVNAIYPYMDNEGHPMVKIDNDRCVGCKQCEKVCKAARDGYGNNDVNLSKVYAAWANDPKHRMNGTSGGVFAAIAEDVLEKKGVVVGAYFDGVSCRHIIIEDKQDIYMLQGSKYVFSSMHGIYKKVENYLNKGKTVVFSGTGCQCAALLSYLSNNANKDNLITMDLVCGGVPSSFLVDRYLAHNTDVNKITRFRNKDKYELWVKKNNQEVCMGNSELPLKAYACGMTNRYSCYNCKYAFAHRKSDLTIGDLWNYKIFQTEHTKGLSMIIAHNDKGAELIKSSRLHLEKTSWDSVLFSNRRIVCGKQPIFFPRYQLADYNEKLDYENFDKLYSLKMRPYDFRLFTFRIYRFIRIRINILFDNSRITRMMRNASDLSNK